MADGDPVRADALRFNPGLSHTPVINQGVPNRVVVPPSVPGISSNVNNQGVSFKDSLLGIDSSHQGGEEDVDDGWLSEDDEREKEDNPDCPNIYLTKEEKAEMRRPWRKSLIIKIMGRTIGFTYLLNRLKNLWKPKAGMSMIMLENDYFLVKFTLLFDYHHAMFGGLVNYGPLFNRKRMVTKF